MTEQKAGNLFIWGKPTVDPNFDAITTPKMVPPFVDDKILFTQVACGPNFTLVLSAEGEVYSLGNPSWYTPHDENDVLDDTVKHWKELSGTNVVQLACGQNFAAALTKDGKVYSWGTGTFGQLGLNPELITKQNQYKVTVPTLIDGLSDIKTIACGSEVMAAVTNNGKLYTWGKGAFGVLGHGDEKDQLLPKKVESIEDEVIIDVKCGSSHMAALNANKEIFTWGNNFLGPLGRILDISQDADFEPKVIELVQTGPTITEDYLKQAHEVEFTQIECLQFNTLALSKDGVLYCCGKGGTDGGGHGDQPHTLFCIIDGLKNVKIRMIASSNYTHTAVVAEDGTVYAWGNNEKGQLGIGTTDSKMYPVIIESLKGKNVISLACGEVHTAAILAPSDKDGDFDDDSDDDLDDEPVQSETKNEEKVEDKKGTTTDSPAIKEANVPLDQTKESNFGEVEGWLFKKGEKGIVKRWRRRWFRVEGDKITYYEKENANRKGAIKIDNIIDIADGTVKFGFNLHTKTKRIYELHAESQTDYDMWNKFIKVVLQKK